MDQGTHSQSGKRQGVGASVRRLEDRRFLDGKGEYLADIQLPAMLEAAFLRSPVAHALVRDIEVPDHYRDQVFFADAIDFIKPIVATGASKGFKASDYPPLAKGKVRFVGDMIAICVASTRAEAEDIAQSCIVDFEELPAVWDIDVALKADAPRIHEHWDDNLFLVGEICVGDLDAV